MLVYTSQLYNGKLYACTQFSQQSQYIVNSFMGQNVEICQSVQDDRWNYEIDDWLISLGDWWYFQNILFRLDCSVNLVYVWMITIGLFSCLRWFENEMSALENSLSFWFFSWDMMLHALTAIAKKYCCPLIYFNYTGIVHSNLC